MAQTQHLPEHPPETAVGIAAIQTQLAEARAALSKDVEALAWETDVLSQVKRSIRKHQGSWIAGAAAAGLVIALLPRLPKGHAPAKADHRKGARSRNSKEKVVEDAAVAGKTGAVAGIAAFALTVLKLLLPVIRPALTDLAADAYTRYRSRGTQPPA